AGAWQPRASRPLAGRYLFFYFPLWCGRLPRRFSPTPYVFIGPTQASSFNVLHASGFVVDFAEVDVDFQHLAIFRISVPVLRADTTLPIAGGHNVPEIKVHKLCP